MPKRDDIQELQPYTGHGVAATNRQRFMRHSQHDDDDVEPLASSTTVSLSKVLVETSDPSPSRPKSNESCSAAALRKVKTAQNVVAVDFK